MKIKKNGFTLIELMVVIALIGILSSVVIPSIWNWRKERVLSDAARKVQGVLQIGRLAAIDANANVVVQFTTGFGGGAYAFVDNASSNTLNTLDPGERVVARETLPPKVALVYAIFGGGGSGSTFTRYTRIGLPRTGDVGRILLANDTSDSYRKITLSAAGNLRTEKSASYQF